MKNLQAATRGRAQNELEVTSEILVSSVFPARVRGETQWSFYWHVDNGVCHGQLRVQALEDPSQNDFDTMLAWRDTLTELQLSGIRGRWRRRGKHLFWGSGRQVYAILRRNDTLAGETSYYTRPVLWEAWVSVRPKEWFRLELGLRGTHKLSAMRQVERVFSSTHLPYVPWDVDGVGT